MIPLSYKVKEIKAICVPNKVHNICRFAVLVNYYIDMWLKHAHTIAPVTKLCLAKVKFKWTGVESDAFIPTNKIVGRDVLLSYPNFNKIFITHTDAIKIQLRGLIIKNGNSIIFY